MKRSEAENIVATTLERPVSKIERGWAAKMQRNLGPLPKVVQPETGRRRQVGDAAAAMLRLSEVLAATWQDIRQRHPEVPEAVIIIGSGKEKQGMKWGHFCGASWEHQGARVHEIFMGAEGLQRPAAQILGTMLHEAAHAVNFEAGIKDTSRQGRYHNPRFATQARLMGLDVVKADGRGFCRTQLGAGMVTIYKVSLSRLQRALTLNRAGALPTGGGITERRAEGWLRCHCQCNPQRIVRMSRQTLDEGGIACGYCDHDFVFGDKVEDLFTEPVDPEADDEA